MERFRHPWSLVSRVRAEPPSNEIFAALVDDLYSSALPFAIGTGSTVLVGAVAVWRTGSLLLAALTAGSLVVAAVRTVITVAYHKHKPVIGNDAAALRRTERWYAAGATAYTACLGAMCFAVFTLTDDPLSCLLLSLNAAGFVAGAALRNSSRPRIAGVQLTSVLLPLAFGSALHGGLAYSALSLIIFSYYAAAIKIGLGGHRLRLIETAQEKTALARSLAKQNFLFETALANMPHGLCMFDAQHRLLIWNKRFCEIFRIAPEALSPGATVRQMIELSAASGTFPADKVADTAAYYEAQLAAGAVSRAERPLRDGRMIAIAQQPVVNGGAVMIFEDVTEWRQAEARAQFLATHDELTGLPNRVSFGLMVNEAIKASRRAGQEFAVMFVDLDRFKVINDTLGHAAGDMLLAEIAGRIRQVLRKSDVVARLGGDQFTILLRKTDSRAVAAVARKILAAVLKPLMIQGQECRVTASIGISLFPSDAQDEETLNKNADAAMSAAKEDGSNNFRFHSGEIKTQSTERLMLESSLRQALERNELLLHYQPKRDLVHGDISGAEALLRWRHPDLGLLPPNRFIPLAEETGLIVPIGRWVLETACAQNMAWQRAGLPAIQIAANLSPRQFADPDLLDDIRAALEKSGMPPQLLELEITESMVMQNLERTLRVLKAMKELGVALAIDDFGTGYSSMALVKQLPIDTLKIDRSFVRDLADDDKAIADAIIALGRALDLTVVAEGVETAEQEAFLRAHRCDEIQGYLISKPIPADEFGAFLADYATAKLQTLAVEAARHRKALTTGATGTQG